MCYLFYSKGMVIVEPRGSRNTFHVEQQKNRLSKGGRHCGKHFVLSENLITFQVIFIDRATFYFLWIRRLFSSYNLCRYRFPVSSALVTFYYDAYKYTAQRVEGKNASCTLKRKSESIKNRLQEYNNTGHYNIAISFF